MAITVQSATVASYTQGDGRLAVVETITLSNGWVEVLVALLPQGTDTAAHVSASGAIVLTSLAATEVMSNMTDIQTNGANASPTFVYSTVPQNAAAIRTVYKAASDRQAAFIGEYLNGLPNATLASAFGITTGQAGTLKTNVLAPQAAVAASIRSQVGQ